MFSGEVRYHFFEFLSVRQRTVEEGRREQGGDSIIERDDQTLPQPINRDNRNFGQIIHFEMMPDPSRLVCRPIDLC
jgi:hypothetical protein